MFTFRSKTRRIRSEAHHWLETAEKVWAYRRDVLEPALAKELRERTEALREETHATVDEGRVRKAIEALERVLGKTGGVHYPRTATSENVEFMLLAAIVFVGVRTYFLGNFEIPTNSMWPTYNGMTPEVFHSRSEEPGPAAEVLRIAALGAWPHRVDAPAAGELLIPIMGTGSLGYVHCRQVAGHSVFLLPSQQREYTFLVGDEPATLRVPVDFDLDWAVFRAFFDATGPYSHTRFSEAIGAKFRNAEYADRLVDGEVLHCIRTGIMLEAGQRMFSFDEIRGDRLLVDRISYHFLRPRVGTGVVFRTGGIAEIAQRRGDTYYVKRLAGVPGDTLEIRGRAVYRNGAPITGSDIFAMNAGAVAPYTGYEAVGRLAPGEAVHVGPRSYFGLGDNSSNSEDSRYWGFIPADQMVGTPLFIYYPLSRHWGLAR